MEHLLLEEAKIIHMGRFAFARTLSGEEIFVSKEDGCVPKRKNGSIILAYPSPKGSIEFVLNATIKFVRVETTTRPRAALWVYAEMLASGESPTTPPVYRILERTYNHGGTVTHSQRVWQGYNLDDLELEKLWGINEVPGGERGTIGGKVLLYWQIYTEGRWKACSDPRQLPQ